MGKENELSKRERILLVEYQITSEAWRHETEVYWSRYNVMFAIHAAILALIGYAIVSREEINVELMSRLEDPILVLSLAGTIFSLVWFFSLARSQAWHTYWVNRLKKIEDELQYPNTLRGMGDYFEAMTRWRFYRRVGVYKASYAIPLCFLAGYISMNWMLFGFGCKELLLLTTQIIIIVCFVVWGLLAKCHKTPTKSLCPSCGKEIAIDFSVCPYCSHVLKLSCPSCHKEVKPDFTLCPYCSTRLR
nr:zinc ribbon domain-containing protein [Candidatus Njordarchaeum guaymaensis]